MFQGLAIMNSKPESMFTRRRVSAAVMSALLTGQSLAGPLGGQVVGGSGSISQTGATTTINQSTQNMAINWQSYNVNVDERVQYIQPNSSSISLNRILSNNGSTIAGRIDGNGQVILVNPNGVFFTPTSVVNVGGIIASGLDIAPSDFMNGNYIFNEVLGTEGKVINSGTINASLGGNVALIGKQVQNDGLIVANLGTVNLAAGKQAVLTFDNGGLLGVRVSKDILQDELGVDPAVMNSGEIHAEGGRVLLTASASQDVFSQAVNTAGLDRATSVVVHEDGSFTLGDGADVVNSGRIDTSTASSDQGVGRIVLLGENVTSSGELHAGAASGNGGEIELHAQDTTLLIGNSITSAHAESQGVGGTVKVLGERVGLFDAAMVDASGALGGGQVLIGGDCQGRNPAVRNASRTLVAPDAQIYADALEYGDGGRIVSWSDESTWFYGSAYSRGGATQGNGGLIEISGKGLSFNGQVDTSAESGSVGTVLFDPTNIVIIDSFDGDTGDNDGSLPDLSGAPAGDFELSENALESLLSNASIILDATNNITIDDLSDDLLNLNITTGSITFTADADGDGHGAFFMNQDDTIRTRGGSITIAGAEVTTGHLVTTGTNMAGGEVSITSTGGISVAGIDTHGGAVTGDTAGKAGGDVTLEAVTGIAVGSINTSASNSSGDPDAKAGNAGSITITASGGTADVALSGPLTANGGNGPTSGDGNDGSGGDGRLINISAGQDILVSSAAYISSNGGNGPTVDGRADGDGGAGGGVTFVAGRDISIAATISSNGGNGPTSTDSNADGDGGDAGSITITAARNLSVSGSISSLGGAAAAAGGWSAGADGAISLNGSASDNTFTVNDNITLAGSTATVNGGGGNDQLVRGGTVATANTWIVSAYDSGVDGINDGILAFGNNTGADAIRFVDIESLIGGASQDSFVIEATGDLAGLIDGGAGTLDTLQINRNGVIVQLGDRAIEDSVADANLNVTGVEMITASAASVSSNEMRSDDVASTWIIAGSGNSVAPTSNLTDAVQFTNFGNLTGSNQGDTFAIGAALNGAINAGASGDTITIQSSGSVVDINAGAGDDAIEIAGTASGLIDGGAHGIDGDALTIAANVATTIQLGDIDSGADYKVVNVETLTGNIAYENSLRGDDGNTTWVVDAPNRGSINGTTKFENFANLVGGGGEDRFEMIAPGSISSIDGGAGGGNTLVARQGVENIWNFDSVSSGTLLQTGDTVPYVQQFSNIQNFVGGGVGNEWADFSGNSAATIDLSAASYFCFDGVIGNGANSTLRGQDGLINDWAVTVVADPRQPAPDNISDGINDGTFSNVNGSLTFIDFANLVGGDSIDNFVIDTAGSNTGSINGGAGNDSVVVGGSASGLIDGGAGSNDQVRITRSGDQTVHISPTVVANADFSVTGFEVIDANNNAGGNTLHADGDNTWSIASANSGNINNSIGFVNFANLVGGDGNDAFTVQSGASVASIGTGGAAAQNSVEVLTGGAVTGAISGGVNADWVDVSGSVGSIDAGAGDDTVTVSGMVVGLIEGGADTDTLNITRNGDQIVHISPAVVANADFSVTGFETIDANNSASGNTLRADANNIWTIDSANSGNINNSIDFVNFANLAGGSGNDTFNLENGGQLGGLINGGTGTNTLNVNSSTPTTVRLLQSAPTGAVSNPANTLSVYQIGTVRGSASIGHTLIGPDIDNDWSVTTQNGGTISFGPTGSRTTVIFNDMRNLTGGSGDDRFTLSSNDTPVLVTGLITGGGQASGGDVLNITAMTGGASPVVVKLGSDVTDGQLNANGIETITGNGYATLIAADIDNDWMISGARSGTITPNALGPISFSQFARLQGGEADDNFMVTFNGTLTASIDGGGEVGGDTIDYSSQNIVVVNFGSANFNGITGIEGVRGNGQYSTLNGPVSSNADWTIDGTNSGTLTVGSESLTFQAFNYLSGGAGDDTFNVSGDGSLGYTRSDSTFVPGLITGGGGNNVLNVALSGTGTTSAQVDYVGTGNTDTVNIAASGSIPYTSAYTPSVLVVDGNNATNTGSYSQLQYRYSNNVDVDTSFAVNYRGIDTVISNQQVDLMTVNAPVASGAVDLGNGVFQVGSLTPVNYTNVENMTVAAAGNAIQLNGVNLATGILRLTGNAVQDSTDANTSGVTAQGLIFDSVGSVGSVGSRISTNVGGLSIFNSGAVYVHEQNGIDLAGMNTAGLVDIQLAQGNVINSNALISSGALAIETPGDIDLSAANMLSGPLSFIAYDIDRLNNGVATNLANMSVHDLRVTSTGDITDSGTIVSTGTTTLVSEGNIILNGSGNDFATVSLDGADLVSVIDINSIGLGGLSANHVSVTAGGQITDANGALLNVAAEQATLRARDGIGSGAVNVTFNGVVGTFDVYDTDAIEMSAANLSAINGAGGTINLHNDRNVTIKDLRNHGDIILTNTGNIDLSVTTLTNPAGTQGAVDANYGGSMADSAYAGSVAIIGSNQNNVTTQGIGVSEYDITAENLFVTQVVRFGSEGRPIRLRVNREFTLYASSGVVTYPNNQPGHVTSTADLITIEGNMNLSGQQLIEIESLADVDEAIFTEVRNYYHEDVAIMLPADQRMTDDDDEEERHRRQAVN
jgi:filamentous hemagglutinin family protein